MPTTDLRWEEGVDGVELWGVVESPGAIARVEELAWVYWQARPATWAAVVFETDEWPTKTGFATQEEAQAWCLAYVRLS